METQARANDGQLWLASQVSAGLGEHLHCETRILAPARLCTTWWASTKSSMVVVLKNHVTNVDATHFQTIEALEQNLELGR